jgi:hypothetical protein
VEPLLSKCLREDVCSLFGGWTILQVDGHVMYKLSNVMHMDLYVFAPLSLHSIFAKLKCTLIISPNDNQTVEMDAKLSEEVL